MEFEIPIKNCGQFETTPVNLHVLDDVDDSETYEFLFGCKSYEPDNSAPITASTPNPSGTYMVIVEISKKDNQSPYCLQCTASCRYKQISH